MKYTYLIITIITLFSCQKNDPKAIQQVKQWQGKEIYFPDSLTSRIMGKDTSCTELFNKDYKILVFVDSTDCTECKLQLYEWSKLINNSQQYNDKLSIIFIIHTPNPKNIDIICKKNKFNYPLFYDKKNITNTLNHFPKEIEFQTFLLDKNNHVIIIGNPIKNTKMWNLYMKIISQ